MKNFETPEQNPEQREEEIDALVENLAQAEGMSAEDVFSDIATFAELLQEDENVRTYFEELAEKIGISVEETIEYAIKKLD